MSRRLVAASDNWDGNLNREMTSSAPRAGRDRRLAVRVRTCVCWWIGIHILRTNIVIDDKLMRDALRATGIKTKREAVEEGLRTLLRLKRQEEIRKIRGKLVWHGDLDEMRTDR